MKALLIAVLLAAGAAVVPTGAQAGPVRPTLPVLRVDTQCQSGHNPNCHPVWITRRVPGSDIYRPVGIWIRFK